MARGIGIERLRRRPRAAAGAVFAFAVACLLAAAPAPSSAAPAAGPATPPDYVRGAPGLAAYPDDDGLILRQHLRISVDAEGRVTRRVETALKMLQEYTARHDMFDPRIDWNDARASLRIEQARTYMADGTVVDAAENSLVPNTAPQLEWAVPFAHLRQMVVAHVGVEHGATSVLAYTITDREPSGVPLWEAIDLQGMLPILDEQITVELPETTTLRWSAIAGDVRPEVSVSTRAGLTSHVFRLRDVPAANLAELPSGRAGMARLVFSTAPDWSEARRFVEEQVAAALMPDSVVAAKAREVAGEGASDLEKISHLHEFVVEGVRTIAWPLAAFDYGVRPVGEVLRSSVGHPLEKAALLAAMLRALGYEAIVVLASSEREIAADVPSLAQLDRAWVRLDPGRRPLSESGPLWLDPTASIREENEFRLAGRAALPLDGASAALTVLPELDTRSNAAALRLEIAVESGEHELRLSGTADLDLAGLYNTVAACDRTKDRLAGAATSGISTLGGAKVEEIFVGEKSVRSASFRATFAGGVLEEPPSGLIRLALPRVPGALLGEALQIYRDKRTLPLVLPAPAAERVEVVLDLPEKVEAAFAPPAASVANSVGSVRRTVERDGRKLSIRTVLELACPVVSPAAYPDLRALYGALEGEAASTVLLRRTD